MKKKDFICMIMNTIAGILLCTGFGMYMIHMTWEGALLLIGGLGTFLLCFLLYPSHQGLHNISLHGNTLDVMSLAVLGAISVSLGFYVCAYSVLFGIGISILGMGMLGALVPMCKKLR